MMATLSRAGALRKLRRCDDGSVVTELGLIAPTMCLLLMGALDIGHGLYVRTVLQGAVQQAARNSGLEGGGTATNQASFDTKVREQVGKLGIANSDVAVTRRFYRTFTLAAQATAEPMVVDTNSNGRCNPGDRYSDTNHNNTHDVDGGDGGQGGAKDAVVYTVRLNYPRLFPLHGFIGIPARSTAEARTVLANQPFGEQASYAPPVTRNCP